MAKYCKKCGHESGDDDQFCEKCGTSLTSVVDKNNKPPHEINQEIKEKTTSNKSLISLFRILLIMYLLLLGCISEYLISANQGQPFFVATAFGRALGFSIFPGVVALVRKIAKVKPNKGIYIVYFIISIVVFSMSTNYYCTRPTYINRNSYDENSNDLIKDNTFIVSTSEYSVVFQSQPKITDISAPINNPFPKARQAELVIPDEKSFCRTEYFDNASFILNNVNREYVYNFLNEYSKYNGLMYPTFSYEENDSGKIGSMRAYKTLVDDKGQDIEFTFFTKTFYGNRSIMTLCVGCPSNLYPTTSIKKFLNSIKKK